MTWRLGVGKGVLGVFATSLLLASACSGDSNVDFDPVVSPTGGTGGNAGSSASNAGSSAVAGTGNAGTGDAGSSAVAGSSAGGTSAQGGTSQAGTSTQAGSAGSAAGGTSAGGTSAGGTTAGGTTATTDAGAGGADAGGADAGGAGGEGGMSGTSGSAGNGGSAGTAGGGSGGGGNGGGGAGGTAGTAGGGAGGTSGGGSGGNGGTGGGPNVPPGCTAATFANHVYLFCGLVDNQLKAAQLCVDAGMNLLIVGSPEENAFIAGKIKGSTWLGGNDDLTEGDWFWWDATQFTSKKKPIDGVYSNWGTGQPNDNGAMGGHENCNVILPATNATMPGQWNDLACDLTGSRAACEAPLQ